MTDHRHKYRVCYFVQFGTDQMYGEMEPSADTDVEAESQVRNVFREQCGFFLISVNRVLGERVVGR